MSAALTRSPCRASASPPEQTACWQVAVRPGPAAALRLGAAGHRYQSGCDAWNSTPREAHPPAQPRWEATPSTLTPSPGLNIAFSGGTGPSLGPGWCCMRSLAPCTGLPSRLAAVGLLPAHPAPGQFSRPRWAGGSRGHRQGLWDQKAAQDANVHESANSSEDGRGGNRPSQALSSLPSSSQKLDLYQEKVNYYLHPGLEKNFGKRTPQ